MNYSVVRFLSSVSTPLKALLKEKETRDFVSLRTTDAFPWCGSLLLSQGFLQNGVCTSTLGDRFTENVRDDTGLVSW